MTLSNVAFCGEPIFISNSRMFYKENKSFAGINKFIEKGLPSIASAHKECIHATSAIVP
jgi:hypothetical protein